MPYCLRNGANGTRSTMARRRLKQVGRSSTREHPPARSQLVELRPTENAPPAPFARARAEVVKELEQQGYSEREVSALVVPRRTLARRRAGNELLSVEETDKALRLKRIASLAEKVFGDATKAHRWLRKAKASLAGETPLAYLASEEGARVVEEMLRRIEQGIFA